MKEITLLHVPRGNTKYLTKVATFPEDRIFDYLKHYISEWGEEFFLPNKEIKRCLEVRKIIEIKQPENCLIAPIFLNGEITSLLIIVKSEFSDSERVLIEGFLAIYNNYLVIIDDNEHDTLTGLLNRKTFDTKISHILSVYDPLIKVHSDISGERRQVKPNHYHWLGILDIDFFKKINDNYGHLYGDEVLLLFSDLMYKTFRETDLLFRYGGEEFVVVLSPTYEEDALLVFERFRQQVQLFKFPQVGKITVSIGFVKINVKQYPAAVVSLRIRHCITLRSMVAIKYAVLSNSSNWVS